MNIASREIVSQWVNRISTVSQSMSRLTAVGLFAVAIECVLVASTTSG